MTPAATVSLAHPPSDLVGADWIEIPGDEITSTAPAEPTNVIWQGTPSVGHVDHAIAAARAALPTWSGWAVDRRVAVLERFKSIATERVEELADLISLETGKARWESLGEAKLIAGKVDKALEIAHAAKGLQLPRFHIRRALHDAELAIEDHHSHHVQVHGVASLLLDHINLSSAVALAEGLQWNAVM